jgi:hypothetical protein
MKAYKVPAASTGSQNNNSAAESHTIVAQFIMPSSDHHNILGTYTNSPRAQRPLQFLHTQSSRFIRKDDADCEDVNEHAKAFQPILENYRLLSSRSKTQKLLLLNKLEAPENCIKVPTKIQRSKSINPPLQNALKIAKSHSIIGEKKEPTEVGSRNGMIHSKNSMATVKVFIYISFPPKCQSA